MSIKLNIRKSASASSSLVYIPSNNNSKVRVNCQAPAGTEWTDMRAVAESTADIISQQTTHSDIPENASRTLADKFGAGFDIVSLDTALHIFEYERNRSTVTPCNVPKTCGGDQLSSDDNKWKPLMASSSRPCATRISTTPAHQKQTSRTSRMPRFR